MFGDCFLQFVPVTFSLNWWNHVINFLSIVENIHYCRAASCSWRCAVRPGQHIQGAAQKDGNAWNYPEPCGELTQTVKNQRKSKWKWKPSPHEMSVTFKTGGIFLNPQNNAPITPCYKGTQLKAFVVLPHKTCHQCCCLNKTHRQVKEDEDPHAPLKLKDVEMWPPRLSVPKDCFISEWEQSPCVKACSSAILQISIFKICQPESVKGSQGRR